MQQRRWRLRWVALIALTGAAALSGCYWDPYTGYLYPYPPPPPYSYPYGAPPPSPTAAPQPAPAGNNAPVQQTPLPPTQ
jgi:hypothetical protein